jgi:prophage regulatory protein
MNVKILRLPDVMKATGLSRSSIYSFVKESTFPKPRKLSARAVGWLQSDIEAWIVQRVEHSATPLMFAEHGKASSKAAR